jgi:hypothetical protein
VSRVFFHPDCDRRPWLRTRSADPAPVGPARALAGSRSALHAAAPTLTAGGDFHPALKTCTGHAGATQLRCPPRPDRRTDGKGRGPLRCRSGVAGAARVAGAIFVHRVQGPPVSPECKPRVPAPPVSVAHRPRQTHRRRPQPVRADALDLTTAKEHRMIRNLTSRTAQATLVTAVALAAPIARAETMEDMRFGDIATVKMMDKNKDGMVTRAEFLDMMGKLYDMKAKQMKSKAGVMSSIEFDEFVKYLRAGA